jgi:hypothetical protein
MVDIDDAIERERCEVLETTLMCGCKTQIGQPAYRKSPDDLPRMAAESYVTWALPCIRLKTSQSNCLGVTAWSGIGPIDPRSR